MLADNIRRLTLLKIRILFGGKSFSVRSKKNKKVNFYKSVLRHPFVK